VFLIGYLQDISVYFELQVRFLYARQFNADIVVFCASRDVCRGCKETGYFVANLPQWVE
jgi:hypothetical protein